MPDHNSKIVKKFFRKANEQNIHSLTNGLILLAAVPFFALVLVRIITNQQINFEYVVWTGIWIIICFIFMSIVIIVKKEVPVYPPFKPVKGKAAVVVGLIQLVILVAALIGITYEG